MKKILYLLLLCTLFISCSSDDENSEEKKEQKQDYTSFSIITNEDITLINSIAAYKKDGKYFKIATLGDLTKGIASKEIKVNDVDIKEVYLFSDYPSPSIKSDTVFILKSNVQNNFELGRYTKGIKVTDKSDPTQYPQ